MGICAGKNVNSVHEGIFKTSNFSVSDIEKATWKNLFALREQALPELEKARQSKTIGKSLDAVLFFPVSKDLTLEDSEKPTLLELCNVSEVVFDLQANTQLRAEPASKYGRTKCERCWHWETDIGQNAAHPTICARCTKAVLEFQPKTH